MKREIVGKLVHVLLGIALLLLFQAGILDIWLLGLLIVLFTAVVLLNFKYEKELLTKVLIIGHADRRIPGINFLTFLLGSWIVLVFIPGVAYAAIAILTFGDPLAH